MDTEIIIKNRSKNDRRKNKAPYHGPERRTGKERRKLDKRLRQMIDENDKNQAITDRLKSQSGTGNVIRRRKNGNERVGGKKENEGER